jgi:CRISPR-associated protein (TIGR03984 family)
MEQKKKNCLQLNEIKSIEPGLEDVNDPMEYIKNNFQEDGFVVAYLDYTVLIGRYLNGQKKALFYENSSFDSKFLQKIRVFNRDKEVFIWWTEEGFKGRLRVDQQGNGTFVVDANQVLWGTKAKKKTNDFTILTEERGTELILPFPFSELKDIDDEKNRVFLKTRNYIGDNDIGQSTYVDSRFLGFATGKDMDYLK